MKIEFQKLVDSGFAADLTRKNMVSYYTARNISWDNKAFIQNWEEYQNYLVTYAAQAVGVLRLSSFRHMFLIRDIQLDEGFQNKGIGGQCINFAIALANECGFDVLGLRVFSENPARKLYERMGFVATKESDGLVQMELSLTAEQSEVLRNEMRLAQLKQLKGVFTGLIGDDQSIQRMKADRAESLKEE